jgi:vacuolar-type H+-ATPase subunit C/Vma6
MPVLTRRAKQRFRDSLEFSAGMGERDSAFAKACGIIGKSFTGKRIAALSKLRLLSELDRLVFSEDSGGPSLQKSQKQEPQKQDLLQQELLINLESRILQRTTRHILAVINSFTAPPELLVCQLRACEYANLKTCLHHISAGKTNPPLFSDIGRFGTVRFEAYPDIAAMVAHTDFRFIIEKNINEIKSPDFDFASLEAELDRCYYTLLAQSLHGLSSEDRLYAQQILADEISLRNCVWALRLRTYFKKTPDEAAPYLMDQKMSRGFSVIPGLVHPRLMDSDSEFSLADEAHTMLDFPLDVRSAWKGWRWESMLNPEQAGESWEADPRYFQNAASRYIYRLSSRCFRRMPSSISSIFCFIKLKQFEENVLTSIAEGLGFGMASKEVFDLLGVEV